MTGSTIHPKALELTATVYWSLPVVQVWLFASPVTVAFLTSPLAHTVVCVFQLWANQTHQVTDPPKGISCRNSHHLLAVQSGWIDPAAVGHRARTMQHNSETLPAETRSRRDPSSPSYLPDLLPKALRFTPSPSPRPPFQQKNNLELAPDTKRSCVTPTKPAHSC